MKTEVFFIERSDAYFTPLTDRKLPGHRGLLWRLIQDLEIFENAEAVLIDAWKMTGVRGATEEKFRFPTTGPIAEAGWKDAPVTIGVRSKDARSDLRLLCGVKGVGLARVV